MTKEYKTLQFYHIILISMLISPLLILNSNSINKKRHQEKLIKNEMKNLFLRKLDFTSDTNKICEKGTDELKKYYKTGDGEKLGIKDGKIESGDNPEHINALVNLVSGEGDSTENATNYAKHLIPVIIFLVIAILSLPGWLVCCICNCSNCCCCCCCKKQSCKLPFYIVTLVIYAFVAAICIYGLSQSNSIFVGLADTECSLLRFTGEVLDGETKGTIPKWVGISGIQKLFADISYQISRLDVTTKNSLETNKETVSDNKDDFEDKMQSLSSAISSDAAYKINLGDGDYSLDIVDQFGVFSRANKPESPSSTLMDQWYFEYSQTSTNIENTLNNIYSNYVALLGNNNAINTLNQGIQSINNIKTSFDGVKDQISGIIIEYSDTIDEYGKLAFKVIFSVLMIIDLAIAGFITLLFFCSFQACQNCCIRCILKSFLHILWNILALLTFFTLLFGFILTLFGTVGKDLISVVEFLVSDKNLDKQEPVLLADAAVYLKKCVNGDGDIKNELNLDLSSMNNIDQLTDALERIETAKRTASSLIQEVAYNAYKTEFDKRISYAIGDIKLIRSDKRSSKTLSDFLDQINSAQTNILWSRSCDGTPPNCNGIEVADISSYSNTCVKIKDCSDTNKIQSLYTSQPTIQDKAKVLDAFVALITKSESGTHDITTALSTLKTSYEAFVGSETAALNTYKTAIESLSGIFTGLTGNGDFSDILNCLFIGKNVKIILKSLDKSLGTNFYNVGVCLLTSGVAMLVSISFTILLNIIFNSKDEKPGMK